MGGGANHPRGLFTHCDTPRTHFATNPGNAPPSFTNTIPAEAEIVIQYIAQLTASDPEFNPITFEAVDAPEWFEIAADGNVDRVEMVRLWRMALAAIMLSCVSRARVDGSADVHPPRSHERAYVPP